MKAFEIKSSKNDQFKQLLKLKQKKHRLESQSFLIEGYRFVMHALETGAKVQSLWLCEALLNAQEVHRLEELSKEPFKLYTITEAMAKELSDTVSPQGAFAVVTMPETRAELKPQGRYLALDRLQDPGNLGTIIRTADAAGFDGIFLSRGTVDPYGEKVLRSTMGSIFSLPLMAVEDLAVFLGEAANQGYSIMATALNDSILYTEAPLADRVIIVIGNEAQGISDEVFEKATHRITIPISGSAESLNAAVAAAIVIYESDRQRRK